MSCSISSVRWKERGRETLRKETNLVSMLCFLSTAQDKYHTRRSHTHEIVSLSLDHMCLNSFHTQTTYSTCEACLAIRVKHKDKRVIYISHI